jgi:hypothetical protein
MYKYKNQEGPQIFSNKRTKNNHQIFLCRIEILCQGRISEGEKARIGMLAQASRRWG